MVWIPGLYQRCLLEIFSPSCGFSSQSLDIVFHGKVFNFNEVRLINYLFYRTCVWYFIKKVVSLSKVI